MGSVPICLASRQAALKDVAQLLRSGVVDGARVNVTPECCAAMYDCLRMFNPFTAMNLPDSDEVEFHVKHRHDCYAEHIHTGTAHSITVSDALIGSFDGLAQVMAHEMLHAAQLIKGTATQSQHNAEYRRLARTVCKEMCWDIKAFVG